MKTTLNQLAHRYIKLRPDLAASTMRDHMDALQRLIDREGPTRRLSTITTAMIAEFDVAMASDDGLALSTRRRYLRSLRSVLATAIKHGMMDGPNPTDAIDTYHPQTDTDRVYVPRSDVERLIEHLGHKHRAAAWLGLLRLAGLRRREALAIRWCDVNWGDRTLTVYNNGRVTNKRKRRVCPLDVLLGEVLRERLADVQSRWHEHLAPLQEQTIVRLTSAGQLNADVLDACAECDIEPWERLCQSLRLSCESDWVRTPGVTLVDASRWIGHSLEVMMRFYAPDRSDAMAAITGAK